MGGQEGNQHAQECPTPHPIQSAGREEQNQAITHQAQCGLDNPGDDGALHLWGDVPFVSFLHYSPISPPPHAFRRAVNGLIFRSGDETRELDKPSLVESPTCGPPG